MEVMLSIVLLTLLLLIVVVGLKVLFSILTMTLFHGAYFAGTSEDRVKNILDLAKIKPSDTMIDIGAGDGRLIIAAAQLGAQARGIEINPRLVWQARRNIKQAKLQDHATMILGDLWHHDLSPYSVITIYGITYMMERLGKKIQHECRPGTRVISVYFKFPGWQVKKTQGECYLYIV